MLSLHGLAITSLVTFCHSNQRGSHPVSADRHLILVDGSSYLFRAYHALPKFTNRRGEPTGAIYGVVNMLKKLHNDHINACIAVIFDARGKTFRDELYPQYKANRPPIPEDLAWQIAPLHELVIALGLPLLAVSGVEADDVIGTLATQARDAGIRVMISTSDKDITQLVDQHITIINSIDDKILDPSGVEAKFGVPPHLMVDYLTLAGDSVDNIPGVPKVGPKTAAKWLNQYGSLSALVDHAEEIKGKVGENLRASLDQLPLSRTLVTIKCDVPLEHSPESLVVTPPDRTRLKALFERFEFKLWMAELNTEPTGNVTLEPTGESLRRKPTENRYELVLDEMHFNTWMDRLFQADVFAFDTETTSLEYVDAVVVGVSFAVEPNHAAYVPFGHDYPDAPTQLSRDWVLDRLKPLLEDPNRPKIGQNLKYDLSVLTNHGVNLRGAVYDTMLESYVLDNAGNRHDMDSLALRFLGRETTRFEDIAGKGVKQLTFNQIPLEKAAPYAAEDADVALQLHHCLWQRLSGDPSLLKLFNELEMPLVDVLSTMERNGVCIDVHRLKAQSDELATALQTLEIQAHKLAGEEFNLGSPKQIQEILYERQGLPVLAKTPKGQPSTGESVLHELAESYPLPRTILEHRVLAKLRSTYTEALPACVNRKTGRVHTSYRQAVASTGRLSSSDPNLQNIPVRTPEGRRIRQAFIAPEGSMLLAADYSQIELRIMAHLSQDEGLCQAFAEEQDIHQVTASEVFAIGLDEVTNEQRRRAKAINFGLIYGMSAFGLARQLGLDRGAAQAYVDRYFERYPKVKEYMEATKHAARESGFVETVFGRRLYLPDIKARNFQRRSYAERTAINAPMQGTAADIVKRAMIRVHHQIVHQTDMHMIMQVHDELVFEVSEARIDELNRLVCAEMRDAVKLSVPLVVNVGVGKNWDEAH